jgi:hypothetical protein
MRIGQQLKVFDLSGLGHLADRGRKSGDIPQFHMRLTLLAPRYPDRTCVFLDASAYRSVILFRETLGFFAYESY